MAGSNKGVVATQIQQIYPHAFYVCTLLKTIDIIAAYEQVNVMTGSLREKCTKEWCTIANELAAKVKPKIPQYVDSNKMDITFKQKV